MNITDVITSPAGLVRGIYALQDHKEVEKILSIIQEYGLKNPLKPYEKQLSGKDLRHFFQIIRERKIDIFKSKDIDTLFQLTNNRK